MERERGGVGEVISHLMIAMKDLVGLEMGPKNSGAQGCCELVLFINSIFMSYASHCVQIECKFIECLRGSRRTLLNAVIIV